MVILKTRNKITDFLMILAWASPFNEARKNTLKKVVSTAAFHARVRGSVPGLGDFKETKNVSSPSTCEFRILCLEDSVISIISPSSGGSPGPV